MRAVKNSKSDVVQLLLEAGANTDLQSKVSEYVRALVLQALENMKSTKVQNLRHIPCIELIMRGYWPRPVV